MKNPPARPSYAFATIGTGQRIIKTKSLPIVVKPIIPNTFYSKTSKTSGKAHSLRKPASSIQETIGKEGGLTELANKIKGLGQMKGATVEIALAKTKEGQEILVAGINSGSKGFNPKQLNQLKEWGINVAPQLLKGIKNAPHAEENIAAFLHGIGATGIRWSQSVVGKWKPGGSSYVCYNCKNMIKLVGGKVEKIQ